MSNVSQILVRAIGLAVLGVSLAGCGQRGPLYLPTDPAAANRATLPQALLPIPAREQSTTTTPSQQSQPPSEDKKPDGTNTNNNNPTGASR
ncbi:lipoprotein [Variovorax sp. OV329]|uniref:LPS translocon maturation chaperone LptM n=1 Tax=Variovorax sp. OV329 TaxID=1882825 RepID=UPI0008EAADC2|nr:lipoprotein [Variovorax sp. OV329]SFM19056.1 lipoprotein-attachment site-containing protein [Variovorax sp. OV329]